MRQTKGNFAFLHVCTTTTPWSQISTETVCRRWRCRSRKTILSGAHQPQVSKTADLVLCVSANNRETQGSWLSVVGNEAVEPRVFDNRTLRLIISVFNCLPAGDPKTGPSFVTSQLLPQVPEIDHQQMSIDCSTSTAGGLASTAKPRVDILPSLKHEKDNVVPYGKT